MNIGIFSSKRAAPFQDFIFYREWSIRHGFAINIRNLSTHMWRTDGRKQTSKMEETSSKSDTPRRRGRAEVNESTLSPIIIIIMIRSAQRPFSGADYSFMVSSSMYWGIYRIRQNSRNGRRSARSPDVGLPCRMFG